MKVLIIGPSPYRSKGGMATVIQNIQNDIKLNQQFNIDIFESYIDGIKIKRLIYSVIAYFKFIKIYKNYDLFHIHMASRGSIFRKAKYVSILKKSNKKVIIHIHGSTFMAFYNKQNEKKKRFIKDLLNSVDMVIGLSDEWKRIFEEEFKLENCVSLNNGINAEIYADAINSIDMNQNNFLALGRIGKRKGSYDLLNAIEKAIKIVPNLKCYMAGDGEVNKFKNMVRKRNLEKNIEITGWIDFDEKIKLLKKVSTIVLPSYNEGLPMAILEGMACGKAIISTTAGAIPEVVKPENGIIIEPGDICGLRDALIRCCNDTEMINKISKANIDKINREFSVEIMHKRLGEYYKRNI